MESTVKKWGNSLGFRIPKSFANQAGVKEGSLVDVVLDGEQIIIKPIKEDEESIVSLLKKVTPLNKHDEIFTDNSTGNEIW
ncbi:MAG: AbrB/MazE/SpoVT family DNA-binding domain-containing protein [Prolixibacteraceae bacterium]|nr:AbrB/MazE/SpoVT family DNA-binding domain-containing protein [Prolixibacteraceae bacterium]